MTATREDLIAWIKNNDKFYAHASLAGCDYEQLLKIYKEVQEQKKVLKQLQAEE